MSNSTISNSNMTNLDYPRVTNNYKKADRKPTKPGSIASGFWGSCFPFTLVAFGTMLVDSLNIVTDWLAYESLKNANISSYIPHNSSESIETFYANLPTALFVLCIVSAAVFVVHVAWYSYMFCRRRRMFLEKRDGVPYSRSCVEEYGGEVLTLSQCLAQDFPMSLLYLLLQISICCDLLFTMPSLIYLISFIATTFSAGLKVVQVVWRAGCFGQRYEYHKSRSLQILRYGSLAFILCALVTSSLNLALLTLHKVPRSFLRNDVFDKVGIKNWILDDKIILYHHASQLHQHDQNNTSVVALKDIMEKESETVTVIPPCCIDEARLDFGDDLSGDNNLFNCSLVYQFQYRASELTIYYNYGYKCFDTTGSCVSRFPLNAGSISVPEEQDWDRNRKRGNDDSGSVVEMSHNYDAHWVKCSNVQLVRNETLLEFNPCAFSPLEQ